MLSFCFRLTSPAFLSFQIADFGLSNVFDEKRRLDTFCGSPLYASPEIVKGVPYVGPEVDCWSLGVLLYTLVYGAMPFDGSNFRRLVKQITQGDFYEPPTPSMSVVPHSQVSVVPHSQESVVPHPQESVVPHSQESVVPHSQESVVPHSQESVVPHSQESVVPHSQVCCSTLSTASPLIRGMLAVTAEKRANIADICSHWWVNDGETKNCLDEAEALANQTPVRLDLLLSLVPKHISSEHMLIQPEEDEANSSLAAATPVTSTANGPQAARSLSMGALSSVARTETPSEISAPVTRREDEKRRRESEARSGGVKKRKEGTPASSVKPLTEVNEGKRPPSGAREAEEKKKPKKKVSKDESGETTEKKRSIKKKDSNTSLMEIDENVEPVVTKKRDSSLEREGSHTEELEKKRSSNKKDTSVGKDTESKKASKKKEVKSRDVSRQSSQTALEVGIEDDAREVTPKAASPMPDLLNEINKTNHAKPVASESKSFNVKSPSNKSVISAVSTDGTLKASDSSLSTRLSPSPTKSIVEVPSKSPMKKQSSPGPTKSGADKLTKIPSGAKVPKTASAQKMNRNSSAVKLSKNESSTKIDTPISNGSCHSIEPPDTEEILKETATKIKQEPKKKPDADNTSLKKDSETVESSKESSQHSSVVSTPARSRTGSESSNEARPGKQDSSRRGSKIFSKAAMWDTMCQQNEKPPSASSDKPRKTPRPGGLNMSDLTKKFEEKPPPERKKPVLSNFKISDVKKSFENKSSDKVGSSFRRMSSDSSGESKRDESLPTSPTRIGGRKEASLPPPGKAVKKSEPSVTKEPDASPVTSDAAQEKSSEKVKESKKEKSPEASNATKAPVSPAKDVRKEKSPAKEATVKRPVDVKREPTPSKRVSPVEDKPKSTSVSKKSTASQPSPRRDVVTPDVDRNLTSRETKKPTATKAKPQKVESSDSSDSESEAEKLLRQLSERRERIEAAKKEKLRKVSLQQEESKDTSPTRDRIQRLCTVNKEDNKGKSADEPSSDKVEEVAKLVKPDSIPSASMIKDAEQPAGAKSATLPRGFKSKPTEKPKPSPQECTASPSASLLKQITAIPPAEVLSPSHRTRLDGDSEESCRSTAEIVIKNRDAPAKKGDQDASRRSSYAEIKLSAPQQPKPEYKAEVRHNVAPAVRPSAPIQPTPRRASPPKTSGNIEGPLQRAPRERIIPIMMEDHEDDDRSTGSDDRPKSKNSSTTSLSRSGGGGESFMQSPLFKTRGSVGPHLGMFAGRSGSRGSVATSLGPTVEKPAAVSPEPIRKSRRERIIPISVEGEEGAVSPPPLDPQTPFSSSLSQHQSSSSEHGMGRSVPIARPESLSSNEDDEEEEDEDDGFQILTAESLFSTLLNRVRNLTRKMSQEDPRNRRLHHPLVPSSPLGFQFSTSPFNSGLHGLHNPLKQHDSYGSPDPGSSFWSSLYSPPRDLSRQNSELSSDGRGGERGSSGVSLNKRGTGGSSWSDQRGSLSRDTSLDSQPPLQHDPGAPYNTLPRVRNIEITTVISDEEQ
ncbi:Protein kinase domain [Trinorchestia longiramus]|nr:Protein kinase domain [Trinorchestia longiramus]